MSEDEIQAEKVDAAETLLQAAGFAQHLQRLGVDWLPAADSATAHSLRDQFAFEALPGEPSTKPETPSRPQATAPTAESPKRIAVPQAATPAASSEPFSLTPETATESYPGESMDEPGRRERLGMMTEQVSKCTRCELLASCRTQTVFGEGSPTARFVFFGEGPGRDEDLSGRPFVGKAGQLLTKMIEACKLTREEVYIMNTVKCRPPNNRNPEPTEIANCREFFEGQLNVLRPDYIICLGLVSARALLQNELSVGRMRGKLHRYFESKVLVTYHPSYLLRTPAAKKAAWDDLQLMLRDAGLL